MNFRSRRLIGAIITTIFASLLAVVPLAEIASAQTAFTTPRYVRTIGGAGRPGVFSWGVEYNPVTERGPGLRLPELQDPSVRPAGQPPRRLLA